MLNRCLLAVVMATTFFSQLLFAGPKSGSQELNKIIQTQRKQMLRQQQQIKILQNQMLQVQKTQAKNKKIKAKDADIRLKKGLKIKSADGNNTFRIGGRLHVDAAAYNEDKRDFGNGIEIRRARINVAGSFKKNWRYRAEYDFAHNKASVKDAWLGYYFSRQNNLKVGQLQVPFGLEVLTSSNNIMFMERALMSAFLPGYKTGLSLTHSKQYWSASSAVYGESVNSQNNSTEEDSWGIAARLSYAPLQSNNILLHFGASAEYREPDADNNIRFRTPPETHVSRTRLLNTDKIAAVNNIQQYGLETAMRFASFSLQAEYVLSNIERDKTNKLAFNGSYISAGWFLTGERRKYSGGKGAFRGLRPIHDYGAVEIALRYSTLDLNDDNINGGIEKNWTLGLNWYPLENIRLMANYVRADANPATAEVKPDELRGLRDKLDLFQMRLQIKF